MAMSNTEKGVAAGCCCGLLVIFFIILMCSFSTLSPREYGVTYNDWSKMVYRNQVTAGGRNLIGPQNSYIKFPRGLVGFFFNDVGAGTDTAESWSSWMDWSRLSVWSSNGQMVNVGLSMNLQLKEESVNAMYMRYGTDPWSTVRVSLVATIKNVCVEYTTLDFFLKRTAIKERLEQSIEAALETDGGFRLLMLNLRSIDLPFQFEQTILDKLLAYQAYTKALYQQDVNKGQKRIELVTEQGEADALVSLVEARALGDYEIVAKTAEAEKALFSTRSDLHRALMDDLGWTGQDDLSHQALHFYSWQNVQQRSKAVETSDLSPQIGIPDAHIVAQSTVPQRPSR